MPDSYFAPKKPVFAMRQGVSPSCVYLDKNSDVETNFDFLCQKFPHIAPQIWQQRFEAGLVFNEQGEALDISSRYLAQRKIYYYRHVDQEIDIPFQHQILFENHHLLVVDKPHFLPVIPTGQYVQQTLLTRLKQQFSDADLTPIHRLDKDTAGVMLFSKQKQSRSVYQNLFAQRQVIKIYHAIAPYREELQFPMHLRLSMQRGDPFYTMKIAEDHDLAYNSETTISILEIYQNWAKYQLQPKTGKMHQLRVHLNYLDIAIKNDELYPHIQRRQVGDFTRPLQLLSKSIQFIDPITAQLFCFESPQELSLI